MKLLISLLSFLSAGSFVFANDLPIGHYMGTLTPSTGSAIAVFGDSTAAMVTVTTDPLPDLNNITGTLTADISLNAMDCFDGSGQLTLDKPYFGMKEFNVTASDCSWNGLTLTGNYNLSYISSGSFSLTQQNS